MTHKKEAEDIVDSYRVGRPKAPQPPKDRIIREGETPEPPKNDKGARG